MTPILFGDLQKPIEETVTLDTGVTLLRGFVLPNANAVIEQIQNIAVASPFRHMLTPGGFTRSVALTNCGRLDWVTDRDG